ncbi:hypothetical protein JGU71_03520 [Antrihabitans sp. YC3-6]|uniref:Transcriptional regulator, AbiEi antitoxin, Type IV TA system n=1 Tax=Antrihabitans stalagmiti TaxID=2799499 RepID=A0A934NMK4_9NOCA|nr:hypothetical protein [Antrihabitans stalagmiti]MBJ8337947.1 hypothetical protein [Antrihabitans stalagmiti]
MPPDLPSLVFRSTALTEGFTDDELQRRCDDGDLIRVRPGVYCPAESATDLDAVARHRVLISSTVPKLLVESVVSHTSAAVLLGLPLWNTSLRKVTSTIDRSNGGRSSTHTHLRSAPFAADEVTAIDGIPVFGPVRTVVDLARTFPFEQAVVVGDAAMQKFGLTHDELFDGLRRWPRRPGAPAARRAIRFMDGRSESVGESRSRVRMHEAGLPAPELQYRIVSADGQFLGRTDFCLPDLGVIGEFDGASKYGKLLRPGQTPSEAIFEEKRREDSLRDSGAEVVRWVWSELDDFATVAARWTRAIERATVSPHPRWRQSTSPSDC